MKKFKLSTHKEAKTISKTGGTLKQRLRCKSKGELIDMLIATSAVNERLGPLARRNEVALSAALSELGREVSFEKSLFGDADLPRVKWSTQGTEVRVSLQELDNE